MADFVISDWGTYGTGAVVDLRLDGGMTASTQFIGPWNQRWSLARMILDSSLPLAEQFLDDARFEHIKGLLVPRSIRMNGFPQNLPQAHSQVGLPLFASYEKAILTVQYSSVGPNDPTLIPGVRGGMISETITPVSELVKLDPDYFQWSGGDPLRDEEAPSFVYTMLDYRFTRHGVEVVRDAVYKLVNHVNDAWISPLLPALGSYTWQRGTVLYTGANVRRSTSLFDGKVQQTVEMAFRIKQFFNENETTPYGHNSFWRAKTQKWERLKLKEVGGDNPIDVPVDYAGFPEGDFTSL